MQKYPWNSIAESLVNPAESHTLTYAQALESPCMTCPTTPCCTHLPLNSFKVTNLVELDHAIYLLNFDHIELGISASGDWSAYYAYPCRFLDREKYKCALHGTQEQPRICQHYNPYNCWYKRVFLAAQDENLIRLDYERMQFLLSYIELDEKRQILSVPVWDQLIQIMQNFNNQPKEYTEPDFRDPALEEWEKWVNKPHPIVEPEQKNPLTYDAALDPCDSCSAYCCKTLVFPQSLPLHASNLDYYRFSLGFRGVELGISNGAWSLIVKTRCRHLDEKNQCRSFGQSERPLICKYYDAWKCDYKAQFGLPRPDDFLRIRFEQFAWICETIPMDEKGTILGFSETGDMRQYVEQRWKGL